MFKKLIYVVGEISAVRKRLILQKERKGAICFYGSSFLRSLILCVPPKEKEKEKEKKSTPLLLEGSWIW
jgi:hypothetical protein